MAALSDQDLMRLALEKTGGDRAAIAKATGETLRNINNGFTRGRLSKAVRPKFEQFVGVDKKPLQNNDKQLNLKHPDADKGGRWIPPPGEGVSLQMAEYLELRVFQLRALYFKTKGRSGVWRAITELLDAKVPLSEEEKRRIMSQEREWKAKKRKRA